MDNNKPKSESNNSANIASLKANNAGTLALTNAVIAEVWEIIDIIDKNHFLNTGEVKVISKMLKKKAHETWDFHQAAHIWIYNSKWEVMIQKRAAVKDSHPWLWDISAAWHVWEWESMEIGALRELEEELGIKIDEKDVGKLLTKMFNHLSEVQKEMKWKPWHNNEMNAVYAFKSDIPLENLKLQEEEVEELKYITIEQFEKEINDPELRKKYVPEYDYYKKVIDHLKKIIKAK